MIKTNRRNEGTHYVKIEKDTLLYSIFSDENLFVNSFNHQAICDIAQSLKKMATTEDKLVEAVFMPEAPFVMAVQWHPEAMYDSEIQIKILAAFIKACKK